jgi:nucleoside-diphosphate-sugar epimerase
VNAVRPTHLLHLAWYAEPGQFWNSVENLRWLEASLRLFRAFAAAGGERAVCAGTCAEYGWERRTHCEELVTPTTPETLYGTTKHALNAVLASYAQQCGVSLAWGRIFFVFGPHEHRSRLAGSVASAILSGNPAHTSHGRQIRDFLYAPDLAEAFVALLISTVAGPVNLASGAPVPIRELILGLANELGRPDLVELGSRAANPAEPEALTADVTRLRDEVGWTARVPFADAVALTARWWRESAG